MKKNAKDQTTIVHAGRHPRKYGGVVNPPVMHASTILSETIAAFRGKHGAREAGEPLFVYGRYGTASQKALAALLDELELYGIGGSWGGYESLVMPFDPRDQRSVTKWPYPGPCFRVHAGLESIEDLIADLGAGFARLRSLL